MATTKAADSRDNRESVAPALPGRVLLVDDQQELRRLLERALVKAGHDVVSAGNGREAIALARQSRFDLVISDVQMPLMTGIELLRKLRHHQPDLPVVLISGVFELAPDQSLADIGAFAILSKPFPFEELHEVALRALGGGTAESCRCHRAR